MAQKVGGLDKQTFEEALRDVLKSVLGSTATSANHKVEFYNKFQREMDEHDRDFEKKYNADLNTMLIFSGLFSAVTAGFIIDLQSELKPDYEEMNNALLEMLLNATTGSLPAGSAASIPRWSGPDPAIVQVQCMLYAALSGTLLASFLAALAKQWLNRYRQNEARGSTADRSRIRERKLTGIETWKFHVMMESFPLVVQFSSALLGFGLSRYLWEVNRSISSVVIGSTSFGFLFYILTVTASIFSFDCPFQTPFSLLIHFLIGLALPYWQNLRQNFGLKRQPPEPGAPGTQFDLPLSMNPVGRGHDLEANTITPSIVPTTIQSPESVTPLFIQEIGAKGDKLDAKCIGRMLVMSTDPDATTSIMGFMPEVIWHSGIRNIPFKRIYDILTDCFDLSGPHPVVIPKMRDVAYLSARAFAHIALQRRCITQREDHNQDSWKALCANHHLLSPTDYGSDSDLKTVLFVVDMTLGHSNRFSWQQTQMTPTHHAWMSHVFLYCAWYEGEALSEVVMDFVENSMSLEQPSDGVIADCLFIIGLIIGVPFHVSDITVKDKSHGKDSVLKKVFGTLSVIFSSESIPPLAIQALQLVTSLATWDVADASYELFEVIMASDNLTDQYWEAACLSVKGAFQEKPGNVILAREPTKILKFLDYHFDLQGAEEDHMSSITFALDAIANILHNQPKSLVVESIRNFNCTSPSFVRGVCLMAHPSSSAKVLGRTIWLTALISDQWFNSPVPIMKPEEMSKFCEHLAMYMVDTGNPLPQTRRYFFIVLFGMLRSLEWRNHIVTRLWSLLANWTLVGEEESFKWCLENAIELLEFTKGLSDGEGFKWWYGTLWFHFEKLDPTVQGEVERIATEMLSGDDLSALNLYLNLIGQEVERMQQELGGLSEDDRLGRSGMELRAQLVTLEGNYCRLARITGGQ